MFAVAQNGGVEAGATVQLKLERHATRAGAHTPPAVIWLKAQPGTAAVPFQPQGPYTLLQKNRMFTPHLLVVPVGSVVHFPNADPFFHNVFSLFNGRKFDLGLYEAGSTKEVDFTREGASYIFCNIHPEMSAVVLALSTPLYAASDSTGTFTVHGVQPGDYELHVWVEGLPEPEQDRLKRIVHIGRGLTDLGVVDVATGSARPSGHLNKFGQPYDQNTKPPY